MWRNPQPQWTSPEGRVIQLGDSAHTFIPSSASGATQAIEDAISLTTCLYIGGKSNIPQATRIHNKLRSVSQFLLSNPQLNHQPAPTCPFLFFLLTPSLSTDSTAPPAAKNSVSSTNPFATTPTGLQSPTTLQPYKTSSAKHGFSRTTPRNTPWKIMTVLLNTW